MQTMTISLPDPLKQFVDSQVAAGSYRSASEYLGELIRADERLKAGDTLEAALLEGLHSPEAPMDSEDWDAIRSAAMTRLATRDRKV